MQRSEQTLRQAQIERASGLIAATTTDATNLYIVLTARGLNPHLKIIARASEDAAEKHLLTAGADSVVSPYSFAGQRIAQSLLTARMLSVFSIPQPPTSAWIWRLARFRSQGIYVRRQDHREFPHPAGPRRDHLAIKRHDGMRFNPAPDERIEPVRLPDRHGRTCAVAATWNRRLPLHEKNSDENRYRAKKCEPSIAPPASASACLRSL